MNILRINRNNKNIETLFIVPENIEYDIIGLVNNYLKPLGMNNMQKCMFVSVFTPQKGVLKKDIFEEEFSKIKEVIEVYGIKNIVVTIADYFNKIMKAKKKLPFERLMGTKLEFENLNIIPCLNFIVLNITPMKRHLLQKSLDVIKNIMDDNYSDSTKDFISTLDIKLFTKYNEAYKALKDYSKLDKIAIDIETTGLDRYKDELLTISFAKSETEGFSVALHKIYTNEYKNNLKLIKSFFKQYKRKVILHNAKFDIPFIVYKLFMKDITDTENMIKGINYFDIEDTMIMAFLCLNAIYRPKLGLKDLAFSKYGNWDNDIEQSVIYKYPFEEVGEYNTIDTMATMYLYNKYDKLLDDEKQKEIYNTIYKPFLPAIIKMSMNGLTINKDGFEDIDKELDNIYYKNLEFLNSTDEVQETLLLLNKKEFNPKSSIHVRKLLFEVMNLPIVKKSTKTGEASTDRETLSTLLNDEKNEHYKKILQALFDIGQMKTVKSTFVDGFLNKLVKDKKGNAKIFGNFNINGTVSGRLSSNNPKYIGLQYRNILSKTA